MGDQFVTINVDQLLVGEPLPGTIYLYIDFRFITFRANGDALDRNAYDRLQLKKLKQIFIREDDRPKFEAWFKARVEELAAESPKTPEAKAILKFKEDANRKMLDIFHGSSPNKTVEKTLSVSKTLVQEIMKSPFAQVPLAQLQSYSQGTVDHSVNVSILSMYLAMQMGYSHNLILQHVGSGALLHDLGKMSVPIEDGDSPEQIEAKMRLHPQLGADLLEQQGKVPNEVKMIVAQHHEYHDGSGFPKKLRGLQIYDLARIVSIANVFDELVADGKGSLIERQRHAVMQLDQTLCNKFDPQKLDKAVKILRLGL